MSEVEYEEDYLFTEGYFDDMTADYETEDGYGEVVAYDEDDAFIEYAVMIKDREVEDDDG